MLPAFLCLGLSATAGDETQSLTYFGYAVGWATAALTWLCVIAVSFIVWWAIARMG